MEKKPAPNSEFVAGLEEPKIDGKAYLKIILNMIWFVTHYVTNQNPYKKTAMQNTAVFLWCARLDSNQRPSGSEPNALST